jgi:uncharacterized membrane protein YkoI
MKRFVTLGCAALVCLSATVWGDDSHIQARQLVREGKILSLEQILARISEVLPGQILEVELERERGRVFYEIELLDEQSAVWELKIDAVSGAVLEQELED